MDGPKVGGVWRTAGGREGHEVGELVYCQVDLRHRLERKTIRWLLPTSCEICLGEEETLKDAKLKSTEDGSIIGWSEREIGRLLKGAQENELFRYRL